MNDKKTSCKVILIVISIVFCVGCNDSWDRHFDSVALAKQEQMIEKGWIPTFIPMDATDINISGDLDAASVYGSYISGDTASLRKHCSSVADSFCVSGYGPKWFQEDLKRAGNTAGELRPKGYEVFHCVEEKFNVVVVSARKYVCITGP